LTLLHIQAAGGVESGVEKSSGVEAKATTSVDEPISGPEKTSGTGAGAETEINRSISEQERASGAEASTDNGIAEPMSGQERASGAEAQADTEINKSMSGQEKVEKHVYRVLSSPLTMMMSTAEWDQTLTPLPWSAYPRLLQPALLRS
jgi:hypothetical protein